MSMSDRTQIQLIAVHNADKKRVNIFNNKKADLGFPLDEYPMIRMFDYDTLRELALAIHYEYTNYQMFEKLVYDDKSYRHSFDKKFVSDLIDKHINFESTQYRLDKHYVFMVDPSTQCLPYRYMFIFVFMKKIIYTEDRSDLAILTYTDEPQVWEQPELKTDIDPSLIPREHFKRLDEHTQEFQDGYIVVRRVKKE